MAPLSDFLNSTPETITEHSSPFVISGVTLVLFSGALLQLLSNADTIIMFKITASGTNGTAAAGNWFLNI
jgi:hypothetical protein